MPQTKQTIEISTGAILKFFAIIFAVFLLYLIKDVIALLFFALIIASTVKVPANWLKRYHIPRVAAVIAIYVGGIIGFALIMALIVTPLSAELRQFSNVVPTLTSKLSSGLHNISAITSKQSQLQQFFLTLSEKLSQLRINFLSLTGNVVGTITAAVFVFILSFYLSIEEKGIRKFIRAITPRNKEDYAIKLWERGQRRLSRWLGAQILLGFVVGLMTFIGLIILRVPYALALALLAGIFELIPTVGPILSAIPAVAIAFIKSPVLALMTIGLYVIVQQLENNILVPKIMQKTVGLNPIITILALLIGVKLAGFTGMVLSIPIVMLLDEFSQDIISTKKFKAIKRRS